MSGSCGELGFTGVGCFVGVLLLPGVSLSRARSMGWEGSFGSSNPSLSLCSCIQCCCTWMAFPVQARGWQLFCSTKSQDFFACWIVQTCIPHRKHSFLPYSPPTQFSQMSGFVSHLHIIKSKLLVIRRTCRKERFFSCLPLHARVWKEPGSRCSWQAPRWSPGRGERGRGRCMRARGGTLDATRSH